jgi:hypothetical protein
MCYFFLMTPRRRGIALPTLGLFLHIGCGGGASTFHQGPANHGCRRDAAVDTTVRQAVDGPVDVWSSVDGASDGKPREVDSGDMPDALFAGDGEGDGGESADACDDGSNGEVGRACGRSPWVLVGQVPNVRQLGGIPLQNAGTVACDLVYRGSSLSSLTDEGCQQFATTGIRTVVDIRSESEQTSPPAACVTEHARLVSAPLPTPYSVSPADYLADLYTAPSMQRVFAILADRASYPVYYHCLYGKDRTGVLTAVILSVLGATRQTIQDEYALSREDGFAIYPESLDAVLGELERIGLDAYFRTIGVPPEQVESMRAILTSPPPA